jgi:hypothetical protein
VSISYSAKPSLLTQAWNPLACNFLPLQPSASPFSKPQQELKQSAICNVYKLGVSTAFKIVLRRNAFNILVAKRFIFYFQKKTSTKNTLIRVIKNQTRFKQNISVINSHSSATQPCLLDHQFLTGFIPLSLHHFFFFSSNFIFFFYFSSRLRFVPVSISLRSVHLNLNISVISL